MKKIILLLTLLSSFISANQIYTLNSNNKVTGSDCNLPESLIIKYTDGTYRLGTQQSQTAKINYPYNDISVCSWEIAVNYTEGSILKVEDGVQYLYIYNYTIESYPCNPENQDYINGACFPKCKEDEKLENGVCVPRCPGPSMEFYNGECVPKCPGINNYRLTDGSCSGCTDETDMNSASTCLCNAIGTTFYPQSHACPIVTLLDGSTAEKCVMSCTDGTKITVLGRITPPTPTEPDTNTSTPTNPTDPNTNPTTPTNPSDPNTDLGGGTSTEPTNPTIPTDPSNPTDPNTNPTDPNTNPSVDTKNIEDLLEAINKTINDKEFKADVNVDTQGIVDELQKLSDNSNLEGTDTSTLFNDLSIDNNGSVIPSASDLNSTLSDLDSFVSSAYIGYDDKIISALLSLFDSIDYGIVDIFSISAYSFQDIYLPDIDFYFIDLSGKKIVSADFLNSIDFSPLRYVLMLITLLSSFIFVVKRIF